MPPHARRYARAALHLFLFLLSLPVAWLVAALVLGAVPANVAWSPPERGITIYVTTNGVHTWIVMPKVSPLMDWRPFAPAEHLRNPAYGRSDHVAFGYGDRDFYLNTPTWADLSVPGAFRAAFGNGPPLLHVEHVHDPRADEHMRPIRLTPAQYLRLVEFVRLRFRLDGEGRTIPLIGRGYNDWDMFYEAHGGYSFVLTCNEWTGRALRAAGIRMGLWTPLSQSVMWRLD